MKKKVVVTAVFIVAAACAVFYFFVPIDVGEKKRIAKIGSPDFAEALESKVLPPLPPKFGGVIKDTFNESRPWWPPTITPPKGAPTCS